jgi:glycosyltransferase involved in cell wall biosynthesis
LKVALLHDAKFPVQGYGGTERLVWWIAKGLFERGIQVVLACAPGSQCPYAEVVTYEENGLDRLPADILHYFNTPSEIPDRPHLVTIGGNGKVGEKFSINTVFVSQNHAYRHGASAFVYNGLDPDEYLFEVQRDNYLVFLAKASWSVKNVKGAIRIARKSQRTLHIMGGERKFFNGWRGVFWEGMVDGKVKADWLSKAAGLLFPVLWHEPFGIAVVEALVSGAPVITTPFGSLPELINSEVGKICLSEAEMVEAVGTLDCYSPQRCRDWALSKFHYKLMADKYISYYEKILNGNTLNKILPMVTAPTGNLLDFN